MKFLNTLLENSEIDESIKDEVLKSYQEIKEAFARTGIPMDYDAELVFSNHILALLKRIKEHSFVEDIDEDTLSEVSDEAFQVADGLVGSYFTQEGLPVNRSEVFLVATHIEMALLKQK